MPAPKPGLPKPKAARGGTAPPTPSPHKKRADTAARPPAASANKNKAGAAPKPPKPPRGAPPARTDQAAHSLIARLIADPAFLAAYRVRRGEAVRTGLVSGGLTRWEGAGGYGHPAASAGRGGGQARTAAAGEREAANGWTPRRFKDALKAAPPAEGPLVAWVGRSTVALTARGLEAMGAR